MTDARFRDPDGEERELLLELQRLGWMGGGGPQGCPDPRLLAPAMEGVLPGEWQAPVAGHIQACARCQGILADLEAGGLPELGENALQRVRARVLEQAEPPPLAARAGPPRRSMVWRLLPVLAACVAVLAVGIFALRRASRAPEPRQMAAVRPVDYAALVRLDAAPVEIPVDALLVFRGAPEDARNEFLRRLAEAAVPYKAGDYAKAAGAMAALAAQRPTEPEAHLFQGVSLLFLGRVDEAARPLAEAARLAAGELQRQAEWYLAISHLRKGEPVKALERLEPLCVSQGARQTEACAARDRLKTALQPPARR